MFLKIKISLKNIFYTVAANLGAMPLPLQMINEYADQKYIGFTAGLVNGQVFDQFFSN